MNDVNDDTSAEKARVGEVGGLAVFGEAMAACLRAQAVREPASRAAIIFGKTPLSLSANEHYSDAVGELETAVALAALGSEWIVARAEQRANDNVAPDYIVFGPTGVFLVCGRQHSHAKIVTAGRMVMVNRRRVPYVRDAVVDADRLTHELARFGAAEATVRPLVVIGGASNLVRGRVHAPVPVLQLGDLVRWILRQPTVYSPSEVKSLVGVAHRLGSWQIRPAAGNASVRLSARFERLRSEVDAARQRYRLWVFAGGAIAIAATAVMLQVAVPAIVGLVAS